MPQIRRTQSLHRDQIATRGRRLSYKAVMTGAGQILTKTTVFTSGSAFMY